MDANDHPEDDLIIAAALEILAGGPLIFDVVIDGLYERGLISHLAGLDEEALFDEVDGIFSMTDALWDGGNLVASTAQVLDGITLTHLVSADELERGMVEATPDLDFIDNDIGMDQAMPLLSGGTCDLVFPHEHPSAHPEGSYAGPPGWLDALPGPGLAVFRRSGGYLVVEAVSELSDDTAELDALRVALAEFTEPGIGFEPMSIFMELLIVHPQLFRTPVRPIAVLLDELGVERRGAWFGLRSTEWITPGERFRDDLAQQIAEGWEFEKCCRQAFDIVRSAWQKSLDGAMLDQPTKRAVSRALLHEPVSQAFASYVLRGWGRRSPGLAAFANELLDQPESLLAPAHYLSALCAERDGDAQAAEAHLINAVLLEPDYGAALEEYAWYAADRGEAARACSLLMQAGAGPGVHEYDYLAEQVERSNGGTEGTAKVGRNDPCPCGSGKRFKQCCINGATAPIERRSGWLCNKMERFALRPFHSDGIEAQAAIFEQMGVDMPQSVIPMLLDLIASDPDMVQEFIDQRGYLLPADELLLLQQWQGIRLELYEVVDVDPGASMTVRDTRSGVEVLVTERTATLKLVPHGYVLTRIAPVGSEHQIIGAVMPVTMFQRDSVLRMLDDGYTTEDMTWWLASICRPPTMQNREGDDLVMCSLTLRPMLMGWDKLPAALDELFGPAEGEVWRYLLDPDGESFVRAVLTREGQNLVVETNSIRRAEEVQERLTHIGGVAFEVIESVQTPLEELAKQAKSAKLSGLDGPDGPSGPSGPSSGPKRSWSSSDDPADMPDEIRQLVEKMIRDQEEKWVDGPVPALGGLTPRQALDDPTRREDLLALLSEFDRRGAGQPAGTTFDVDRIRGLLGLD